MKTFKDRKAENKFVEILAACETEEQAQDFANAVNELRDAKIISEEGEYTEFYVTEREVIEIASALFLRKTKVSA